MPGTLVQPEEGCDVWGEGGGDVCEGMCVWYVYEECRVNDSVRGHTSTSVCRHDMYRIIIMYV